MNDPLKLAFLGPIGTYTHQAAHNYFGNYDLEYIPKESIRETFNALGSSISLAVLPYENSIHGAVIETLDLLQSTRFPEENFICDIIELPVNHCLIVKHDTRVDAIRDIFSHEQALGQCSRFIEEHLPGVCLHKMPSTAAAAEAVAESTDHTKAAICSAICVDLFSGLRVLNEGIQNFPNNFTRFLIIGTPLGVKAVIKYEKPGKRSPTALVRLATGENHESNISQILKAFDLPIQKIDRRPRIRYGKFCDEYVAEVSYIGSSRWNEKDWRLEVERGLVRVQEIRGIGCLLGIYRK